MQVMGASQSTVLARLRDAKKLGLDVESYEVRHEQDGPDQYWKMSEAEWQRLNDDIAAANMKLMNG